MPRPSRHIVLKVKPIRSLGCQKMKETDKHKRVKTTAEHLVDTKMGHRTRKPREEIFLSTWRRCLLLFLVSFQFLVVQPHLWKLLSLLGSGIIFCVSYSGKCLYSWSSQSFLGISDLFLQNAAIHTYAISQEYVLGSYSVHALWDFWSLAQKLKVLHMFKNIKSPGTVSHLEVLDTERSFRWKRRTSIHSSCDSGRVAFCLSSL